MGILGLLAFLWLFVSLSTKLKKGYSFDKASFYNNDDLCGVVPYKFLF